MDGKGKKTKNALKSNDDLIEIKTDKKVTFNHHDNNDDINSRTFSVDFENKPHASRKRKNTKVSRKKKDKENNLMNFKLDNDIESESGKKVKFHKIDIIDVESWKKLNLKLTAEENLDELLKITKGKKGKNKNVSCNCIIL